MSKASIKNALLRCTRQDRLAEGVFDHVRDDLDLWVLELPETFVEISETLSNLQPLLESLPEGGSDYTLHISANIDETHSIVIPPSLAALAASCGFSIELSGSV